MNEPLDQPTPESNHHEFSSAREIVIHEIDATLAPPPRPCDPALLPWLQYAREREASPNQPSRLPRPALPSSPAPATPTPTP